MTLRNEFGTLDGLRVAIVGDILHSRVARSNIVGMKMLGVDVTLVGPRTLLPDSFAGARRAHRTRPRCRAAERRMRSMMLRIQRERIASGLLPSLDDYTRRFQLNRTRLARLRSEAVILHPGPVQSRHRARPTTCSPIAALALCRASAQRRVRAHGRARVSGARARRCRA